MVYKYDVGGTVIKDYNSTASITWTPSAPGSYQVWVYAKDLNSTNPAQSEVMSTQITYGITPPLTSLTLTTNIPRRVRRGWRSP